MPLNKETKPNLTFLKMVSFFFFISYTLLDKIEEQRQLTSASNIC